MILQQNRKYELFREIDDNLTNMLNKAGIYNLSANAKEMLATNIKNGIEYHHFPSTCQIFIEIMFLPLLFLRICSSACGFRITIGENDPAELKAIDKNKLKLIELDLANIFEKYRDKEAEARAAAPDPMRSQQNAAFTPAYQRRQNNSATANDSNAYAKSAYDTKRY